MFELRVPLAVAMQDACGVYEGTGSLSIDEWCQRYVESGDAVREWVALWAVAQQALVTWAEAQEAQRHGDPDP